MPLEVTPPPFAASQRLPYTPAFARGDVPGTHPSGASSLGGAGGPTTAAQSTIIPPAPGGIADPNHAIPALPEAGYTAPSIRPGSISIQPHFGGGVGGGSVYGGASVYGGMRGPPTALSVSGYEPAPHHAHHHVHSPLSVVHGDGWSSSSLPAPRRGPPPPPESMIAPKSSHHQHHDHHPHISHPHQHNHGDPHDRHRFVDFDDGKSDASYYALPKVHKPRSRSGSISSLSDSSSPNEILPAHHRSRSVSGAHRQHRSSSIPPVAHLHSPISPSPLAAGAGAGGGGGGPNGRSPQLPGELEPMRKARGSPAPEEEKRQRLHSYIPSDYGTHESERERHRERRHSIHHGDERPGLRRHNSAQHSHHEHGHHHGHHRHRSGSHVPPPPPSEQYAPSYRPISPTFSGDGVGSRGGALGLHLHNDTGSSGRRRAHSMQGLDRPYNIHAYQTPNVVGVGNAFVYDDGASVISDSKMTFMDGSVAGRTSQYGLPKYPHQPKMDYRRFCVQRGNADVFMD
ncbi:hypothetical protein IAU59_004498 [Kwoniella sp. CBS 9459]